MSLLLEFLVAASLAACILQFCSAWRALGKGRRETGIADDAGLPGVSILKPLKGVDDRLLDNLEGFCRLDYPRYEIVFCVHGASDPALRVARRVKETHPDREIVIVVGDCQEGLNPKVNNMMPGVRRREVPVRPHQRQQRGARAGVPAGGDVALPRPFGGTGEPSGPRDRREDAGGAAGKPAPEYVHPSFHLPP